MTTRFERVQEMIGNAGDSFNLAIAKGDDYQETQSNCEDYLSLEINNDSGLVVEVSCRGESIKISRITELYDLRDFLNYWLEEDTEVRPVPIDSPQSNIDPIFRESTSEIFKKCLSKRSIKYYGIHTIGQLVRKTPGNLMVELHYFSYGKLNRITQRLTDKGLWLGMTEEDIRNWKPQEGDSNE